VTVRKGETWGEAGGLPPDTVVVAGDAEARRVVEAARRAGEAPPPLALAGGDLCRTLGGRGDQGRWERGEAVRVPVDVGSVLVDGRQFWFVAHLVVRRSWWRGRVVAAMNAEFLGPWDVAPQAHPGDGRLDIVDAAAELSLVDRLKARRRLPAGGHVPHPQIKVTRRPAAQLELTARTPVWLDGQPEGEARNLSLRLEPGALTCIV
jgi:putative lipid kinase YegS-like protein